MGDKAPCGVNVEVSQMPKHQEYAYCRSKDTHMGGNVICVGSAVTQGQNPIFLSREKKNKVLRGYCRDERPE